MAQLKKERMCLNRWATIIKDKSRTFQRNDQTDPAQLQAGVWIVFVSGRLSCGRQHPKLPFTCQI
jgi:hypothetical protein